MRTYVPVGGTFYSTDQKVGSNVLDGLYISPPTMPGFIKTLNESAAFPCYLQFAIEADFDLHYADGLSFVLCFCTEGGDDEYFAVMQACSDMRSVIFYDLSVTPKYDEALPYGSEDLVMLSKTVINDVRVTRYIQQVEKAIREKAAYITGLCGGDLDHCSASELIAYQRGLAQRRSRP